MWVLHFLTDSHSRNSSGKAYSEGSAIELNFLNVVDLSKYIIYTYNRLGSSVQYGFSNFLLKAMVLQKQKNVES